MEPKQKIIVLPKTICKDYRTLSAMRRAVASLYHVATGWLATTAPISFSMPARTRVSLDAA